MELLKEFWTKVKSGLRIVVNYFFIILGMVGCFTIGYYYNALRDFNKIGKPKIYKAVDHTLAIDENNNGIIIENRRGTYIVLDAELVTKFFDIKARNMWGQHQAPKASTEK